MENVNYVFLKYLSVILLGYVLKRIGIVTEEDGKGLSRIIINITMPALVIHVISTIDILPRLALLPFICFAYNAVLGLATGPLFKKSRPEIRTVEALGIIGFNIGLFAYPFIQAIWGNAGLARIAMLDLGNAFVVFGLAYALAYFYSPDRKASGEQLRAGHIVKLLLTSVPFLAYSGAILINISGLTIPGFIDGILDRLGQANMVLVLLVLGIFLNFRFSREQLVSLLKIAGFRYAAGLGTGLLLYYTLPFPQLYRSLVLVCLILPAALVIIPFSIQFKCDAKLAGSISNLTMVISFFLMWALVWFLKLA